LPELPEVECCRRELLPLIVGKKVVDVVVDPAVGAEVVVEDGVEEVVVVVDPVGGVDVVVVVSWVVDVVVVDVVVVLVVAGVHEAGNAPPTLRSMKVPGPGGIQYITTPEVPAAVNSRA